jgi:hypothetical protein
MNGVLGFFGSALPSPSLGSVTVPTTLEIHKLLLLDKLRIFLRRNGSRRNVGRSNNRTGLLPETAATPKVPSSCLKETA